MNIKENIDNGTIVGSGLSYGYQTDGSGNKSNSFFKNVWQTITGKSNANYSENVSGYNQYDYTVEEAYNPATKILDVGPFVGLMEHVKRFHLGNEYGSQSNNDVFYDGFEDPTRLTFKVEFGMWGASILDDNTIATTQRNSLSDNVYYQDYDDFPMGLLDLNFDSIVTSTRGNITSTRTTTTFNNTIVYNAVNWLYNRNEDRRAQYLKDFIEGLYTIQRDFPYMFQKIGGVQKLGEVDTSRGQRLKDCTLQLTCISDGIDQKIRSLLELYKKAAWDEIYQRWVLPDIYRFFRMIIYVFDDRSVSMGHGMFNPDQDYFPVCAFECSPCEFVMKPYGEGEYTVDYKSVKTSEPVIEVKVNNVRTYMSNQLFRRCMYIKDIITKKDHEFVDDAAESFQHGRNIDWRFVWMQRMFMMPDEYNAFSDHSGLNASNVAARTHLFGDYNDFLRLNSRYAEIEQPDDTWHYATVSDSAYVIHNIKDLWNAVKSIVTSNSRLIRDSRQSDRYYFTNDLNRVDLETFMVYLDYQLVTLDTEGMRRDFIDRILQMTYHLNDWAIQINKYPDNILVDPELKMNVEKPEQELNELDMNLSKPEQQFDKLQMNLDRPEQDLVEMTMNEDKKHMDFNQVLIMNLDKAHGDLQELVFNLDKPHVNLQHVVMNLSRFTQDMASLFMNLSKPHVDLQHMEFNLSKPEQELAGLIMNLDRYTQNLQEMQFNLDIPHEDLQQVIMNLERYTQNLLGLIMNLDVSHGNLQELIMNLEKGLMDMPSLIMNEDVKHLDLIPPEFVSNIQHNASMIPIEMNEDVKHLDLIPPEFVSNIQHNSSMVPIEMNEDVKHLDLVPPEFVGNIQHNASMIPIEMNLEKPNMEMPEMDMNEDVKHLDLIPPKFVSNIQHNSSMIPIEMNEDVKHLDLVPPEFVSNIQHNSSMVGLQMNVEKPEMEMPKMEMNEDVKHLDLVPPEFVSNIQHNSSMVGLQMNVEKPDMDMPKMEMNEDVKHLDLVPPEFVSNIQHNASMVNIIGDSSVRHLDMISPEFVSNIQHNASLVGLEITGKLESKIKDISLVDMEATHVPMGEMHMNLDKPNMDMVHPAFNSSIRHNASMFHIQDSSLKSELNYVYLEEREYKNETKELDKINMNLQKLERDIEFKLEGGEPEGEMKDVQMLSGVELPKMKMQEMVMSDASIVMKMQELVERPLELELKDEKLEERGKLEDMEFQKLVENGKPNSQKMQELVDRPLELELKDERLEERGKLEDMEFQKIVESKKPKGQKMQELVDRPLELELKDERLEERGKLEDMEFQKIVENKPLNNQKLQELDIREVDLPDMVMDEIDVENGSKKKVGKIGSYRLSDNSDIPDMKMQEMELNERDLKDGIALDSDEKRIKSKEMDRLIDNDAKRKILEKIELFSNLDMDSVREASMQQLFELMKMMQQTVDEVRHDMKMQKLVEVKDEKTGTTMKMERIEQPERSPLFKGKIKAVNQSDVDFALNRSAIFNDRMRSMNNNKNNS